MSVHIDLITPERLALSDEVDFIVAPAAGGPIGIKPRHAPLLAKLEAGEIRLTKGNDARFLAVSGGFIEVERGSRVAVFAETAEFAEEIDVERARLAAERAKQRLAAARDLTAEELAHVEASLLRAILRVKVGQRWRRLPRPA